MKVEFAVVLETMDRLLLAMAKGLLDDAGLDYFVSGDEIALRPGVSDRLIHRTCRVVVTAPV